MRKEDVLIWFLSVSGDDHSWLDSVTILVQEPLDWEHVISTASREGVAALVFHRLKKSQLDRFIPDDVRSRLESVYYTYSAHNTVLYEEFKTVASALEQEHIPIIVLKGICLAARVYENIALRPMRDFDLLVKKEDVFKTLDILGRLRYRPIVDARKQLADPYNYSLTFSKHDGSADILVSLDLHWHVLNATWMMGMLSKEFTVERLWQASEPAVIDTIHTRALGPPHLLLTLSINGFTHCFERMIMLSDVVEVLKRYEGRIDLNALRQEARGIGLENVFDYTIRLAKTAPALEGIKGTTTFYGFKRYYHPAKPCFVYLMTQKNLLRMCRSIFRVSLVITRLLFKRLEHKKT